MEEMVSERSAKLGLFYKSKWTELDNVDKANRTMGVDADEA